MDTNEKKPRRPRIGENKGMLEGPAGENPHFEKVDYTPGNYQDNQNGEREGQQRPYQHRPYQNRQNGYNQGYNRQGGYNNNNRQGGYNNRQGNMPRQARASLRAPNASNMKCRYPIPTSRYA